MFEMGSILPLAVSQQDVLWGSTEDGFGPIGECLNYFRKLPFFEAVRIVQNVPHSHRWPRERRSVSMDDEAIEMQFVLGWALPQWMTFESFSPDWAWRDIAQHSHRTT
jgi:hypothetical protein